MKAMLSDCGLDSATCVWRRQTAHQLIDEVLVQPQQRERELALVWLLEALPAALLWIVPPRLLQACRACSVDLDPDARGHDCLDLSLRRVFRPFQQL